MFDFRKASLADAEIVSVELKGDCLVVQYKDWTETLRRMTFQDVVGYQWFSPEGRQLSHGTIERDDELLSLACRAAAEDAVSEMSVFSFVSTWNDEKILRVVARSAGEG